jgi:hypothetical protein
MENDCVKGRYYTIYCPKHKADATGKVGQSSLQKTGKGDTTDSFSEGEEEVSIRIYV